MRTQCSILEGAVKNLAESKLKVLGGNQTEYPERQFKNIVFQKTMDESDIQGLIDLLNANTDAIMANLAWNQIFFWNFDINPVLDVDHSMPYSGGFLQVSGYNSAFSDPPLFGFHFLYAKSAFERLFGGNWILQSVDNIIYQVYATWVLYEGPAKMLHSYDEFIGDPSLLHPPVPTVDPPPMLSAETGSDIPVVVLDPMPFSRPYKLPVPDYKANYFNENNLFRVKV